MGEGVITPFIKQCFVTTAVGLNTIGLGCSIGFPAIVLPQLKAKDSTILLTQNAESWFASILAVTLLLGNLLTPPIMDRLGRKMTQYALTVIALISWFITIIATSMEVLIIGRLWLGISGGLLGSSRSILIGEYTSPRNRGAFLTTVSLTQAFGIFFVHLIGTFMSWQETAVVCSFFPFVSLVMTIYMPESPSWLVARGRYDECREVFRWLRGNEEIDEVEDMIKARIEFEQSRIKNQNHGNCFAKLIDIIRKREFFKPILIMIHSLILSQFSGGTTMAAFSTVIIGLLMGSNANVHFWMVFLDSQRIICNIIAIYVINRTKRRVMIFTTGVLSVGSHLAIAAYVYCRSLGWTYDGVWLPALLINLQVFAVGVGTVPMPQVIAGEVFSLEYRSVSGTISMTAAGVLMFLNLKTFTALVDQTGLDGTYLLYGIVILVNLIIVMILLPETKGKTLQQIEEEFRGRARVVEEVELKQSLQSNSAEICSYEKLVRASGATPP